MSDSMIEDPPKPKRKAPPNKPPKEDILFGLDTSESMVEKPPNLIRGEEKSAFRTLDQENAAVLTEIIIDPMTTEHVRVQLLNKLLDDQEERDFFDKIIEEQLDYGACPYCDHENHWLTPETELNQRGIVTSDLDGRVSTHTTREDCETFQEACLKKKTTF